MSELHECVPVARWLPLHLRALSNPHFHHQSALLLLEEPLQSRLLNVRRNRRHPDRPLQSLVLQQLHLLQGVDLQSHSPFRGLFLLFFLRLTRSLLEHGAHSGETQLGEEVLLDEERAERGGALLEEELLEEGEERVVREEVVPESERGESALGVREEALGESRESLHSESVVAHIQVLERGVEGECLLERAGSVHVGVVAVEVEVSEGGISLE